MKLYRRVTLKEDTLGSEQVLVKAGDVGKIIHYSEEHKQVILVFLDENYNFKTIVTVHEDKVDDLPKA